MPPELVVFTYGMCSKVHAKNVVDVMNVKFAKVLVMSAIINQSQEISRIYHQKYCIFITKNVENLSQAILRIYQ